MANNNMTLVCAVCVIQDDEKEKDNPSIFWLAKRMANGYYTYRDAIGAELDVWFDRHSHIELGSQDHFSLQYRIEPNYDIGTGIVGLIKGQLGGS